MLTNITSSNSELNGAGEQGSPKSPFIALFEIGMEQGQFKDLGIINQLKTENPDYSSYIDTWVSHAIHNKLIEIGTDGAIKYISGPAYFIKYDDKSKKKTVEPVANTITKLAVRQSIEQELSLSTCNFFPIADNPEAIKEYKNIVGNFLKQITELSEKKYDNSSDKIYYATLSTCTFNKEDYNEI